MDQSTHDVRMTNWLNIISQCQNRPTGISAKQWLAENDVNEKSYYYWLRKIRREAYEHRAELPDVTKLPDVTNANCWAHARRAFADAVKAADKKDPQAVKSSVAYRALQKIAEFYSIDTGLKELPKEERLKQRQEKIQPLVEEFFAQVKQQVSECAVPPKSKTGQGLNFIINQEKYSKVFLKDGDVPIDNSASERAIRTFCVGKKNWMFHNTARGAEASALVYSISETAKLNNLSP